MRNYTVKIGGKLAELNEVTVSKEPFNKVFEGRQRPLSQTEKAYFVTADISGKTEIEITVFESFENYEIRPLEYGLGDSRCGNTVKLTVDKPMQFTFEPDGFHNALHVFLNAPSEKPCGSNVICFGKGTHDVGLIWLTSGQTLYLEEGAIVYGMIYAKDAHDIKIMGRGIIDSSPYPRGNERNADDSVLYKELKKHGVDEKDMSKAHYRSANIILYNCKNVYVEGLTFRDAMMWAFVVRNHCENIVIDNIKIVGQWRYNSDGIDICASRNIAVKNSFIRSFDDCFVARAPYLPGETEDTENVIVKNCVSGAIGEKIFEVWCGDKPCTIRNISFEDIYLIRVCGTGINITTWFGSERSFVENVSYKNICMDFDCDRHRMDMKIESIESPVYVNTHSIPTAVHIGNEKIGRSTGNQGCEEATDYSGFNVRYTNISFENVRINTDNPRIEVAESNDFTKVCGIHTLDCDFSIDR